MSKRKKLLINIILITILVLLVLVSTLLYINYYPRVSIHLISDNELYDTLQIKKNSSIPALKKPEKEGYRFVGWFRDQECTDPFQYNEALSNDIELYAKFEAIDYSLTYNCVLDGVVYTDIYDAVTKHINDYVKTPDGSEEIVLNGNKITLNSAKLGYTFAGWSTTQNANSAACGAGGDFLMPASNVNLFAVWEPNTYDVSFYIQDLSKDANVVVDNDGFVRYSSQNQLLYKYLSYKYSYKMEVPEVPSNEKGYYQFVGWYLDENFEKAVNFDQVYMGLNQLSNSNLSPIHDVDNSKPIVLFAKWQVVKFNVLFSLNKDARPGSIYSIANSSIMVPDSNGSVLNSDYFKAKKGFYYKAKMGTIDGGVYSNELLEGRVYYSTNTSIVSHKFLGWFTEKNGGVEYNSQTQFDPEDFDDYYTNRDPGFSFLEPGVRTYILYANWEEYLHISYKYNNKTYDNQPVSENGFDKLRDIASMPQIVRDGYYFGGWSRTSSNSSPEVYDTKTNYKFITNAAQMGEKDTFLFANGVRSVSLYPYWKPNEYHIKYDFSINTLADGKVTCIEKDPQNIVFSEYLQAKLLENPVVKYNTKVDGQWENHIVYNAINTQGESNATYVVGSVVYLLCGWALVDSDNKVLATYNDGEMLTASSKQADLYKYSTKVSQARDDGEYTFTIKAIWTTQVVVSFDKGFEDVEGDVPESIKTMTGKNISIPTGPNPTRPYHTFKGWVLAKDRFTSDGVTENYSPATRYVSRNSVAFATDTTLYASWEPIRYTLNIYNTNVDGSRSSRILQVGMTYKDFGVNISKVTLGQIIGYGTDSKTITNPSGYALDGFTLSAGGDVVFANGTDITISTKYDDADGNKVALFDPLKSSTVNIYVKYSIKEYTLSVEVKDPDGNPLEGFETIVIEKVRHGVAVNDFISTNKIKTKISLPDGIVYDYWKISGIDENIDDIDKCYVEIDSDMTITLYTKIETFTLTLSRRNPVTNKLSDPVVYENIAYGTSLNDVSGIDISLENYFGYESGKWYRNGEVINTDEFVVESDVTLVSGYDAKEINIIYHKSTDSSETVAKTVTVPFAQNFNLPDQSLDDGFKVENMALNKWTLIDGKDFGKTFEDVELSLKYLAEKLGISEEDVTLLFSDVDGTLTLDLYASYAQLYYLSFATSDGTFRYEGSSSKKVQYVSGDEIDLISFVRDNISSVVASTGYVYDRYWKVVGDDDSKFDITEVKYGYTITKDIEIIPVIEKEKYTIQFVAVYGDNDAPVIENSTLSNKTLGDSFNIPSSDDIQNILVHNGVSYRALKWYLNNNAYEMGASITIDESIIEGGSTYIVVRLQMAKLRSFTYYVSKNGVTDPTITGATGDVIKVGLDSEGKAFDLNKDAYSDVLTGWKIGDTVYNIGDEYEITDSTPDVFVAVWETKKITIVYHANNGTNTVKEQEISYGVANSLIAVADTGFVKEMYRITSWKDDNGTTFALGATITLKQNGKYNLYAQWTRVYEIKYTDGKNTIADSELLYEGGVFTLPSADEYATAFIKVGHYINAWKYGNKTFDPGATTDINGLGNPDTKDIVFEVEWGADTLTITIVYTDVNESEYSRNSISIEYGNTPDIDFDTTRQTIYDANGIQYSFVQFKDANNKTYNVVDGKIEVGVVTQTLTLTTVYKKVLKLTYDLSAFGKANQTIDAEDGKVIGAGLNNTPFLEVSDKVAGKVFVGWADQDGNKYKAITSGSGYNYIKNMADHFTITTNVTLSPILLDEYKIVVWENLTNAGEFKDKDEYTLVEEDTNEFVYGDEYVGFVMSGADYVYNPSATTSYDAKFTFVLTSDLASQYLTTKEIHLYPIKTIKVTFVIEATGYSKQEKYKAGKVISLPADATTSDTANAYFDSWELEDGTAVDFGVQNKYYQDTTIRAVYKDFYSVQYKGAESNQSQAAGHDNKKIKLNEEFTLMSESEATAIYQKDGHTLKGFYLCYSEDGVAGDHYGTIVNFAHKFNVSDFLAQNKPNQKDIFVFPAWEKATMTISFASNPDSTEFTYSNSKNYADSKQYTVEAGSTYTVSASDNTWSITFKHITDLTTRTTEEVTVSIKANRVNINYSITNWLFQYSNGWSDETIKNNGEFKYVSNILIGFNYDKDVVSLNVTVRHNDQVVNWEILTVGGQATSSVSDSAESGAMVYTITVKDPSNQNKVYMLDGWYIQGSSGNFVSLSTVSRDDIKVSNGGWTLTITALKDSATLYVNFIDGYVKITQKSEFVDGRDVSQEVSLDGGLTAKYIYGVQIVDKENCNIEEYYPISGSSILSVNPKASLNITYFLETDQNWQLYGIYIVESGQLIEGTWVTASENYDEFRIGYTLTSTTPLTFKFVVVPKTITVSFTGYDGSQIDTKNYEYNARINTLSDVTMPQDQTSNGVKNTFVSWQYDGSDVNLNMVLTSDITINSKWERLYKVVVNNGSSDQEHWLIYRDGTSNLSSANGVYSNFVSLTAVVKNNYSHTGYLIEAYKGGSVIKSNTTKTKLYTSYLKNDFIQSDFDKVDYIKISPTYEKMYTIIVKNEDGSISETLKDKYRVNDIFTVANPTKAGYSFAGWSVSYKTSGNDKTYKISKFDSTSLSNCGISPENDIILSANNQFEIYFTPEFVVNSYNISFATNNESMGSVSSPAVYSINYDTTITFTFDSNGGTAKFVDANGRQVEITYTSLNGNTFTGFYDSLSSAVKLGSSIVFKYENDVVIYGVFKLNPVTVTATLMSKSGSDEYSTELIGGSIKVGNGEAVNGVNNFTTYSSSDTFEFVLTPEKGFKLTSVTYTMGGASAATLSPDASGKYSILLTGDCAIDVLFDALQTSLQMSVNNTTTLTNTPYAYIYSSETDATKIDKTFESLSAQEISTDYYLKEGTVIVNANPDYYSIDKFTYKINGGAETAFSKLRIEEVSTGYKLSFMYQSESIEIIVYIKAKQVEVTYYDMDLSGNKVMGTRYFDYGITLTNDKISANSPKTLVEYRFDKDGNSTTVPTSVVGGLNFKYIWGYKDASGMIVEIGNSGYTLNSDVEIYPISEKHYFLTYEGVHASALTDSFSASNTVNLKKLSLSTGYELAGYKVYLGLNKSVEGITITYNGTNFIYNNEIVNTCDISMFADGHASFASSRDKNDFSIYLEAIEKVKEYEIKFEIESTSAGDGTIEVVGSDGSKETYNKNQTAIYKIPHFYKLQYSVVAGVKTIKVLNASSVVQYTVRYVPASACVCGKLQYNKNNGNWSEINSDTTLAVENTMNFKCIFNNSNGHVDFVFKVDANIPDAWILALTINNGGNNIEYVMGLYDESGNFVERNTSYTTFNRKQLKYSDLKVLRVIMERTKSFTYSIEYNSTYYKNSNISKTYTIINDGSEMINVTASVSWYETNYYTYFYNGSTSEENSDYGHALVHYKNAVKDANNYITGYTPTTVDSTASNFSWYEGDQIYLTLVDVANGYELLGIYDGTNPTTSNKIASKESATNRYVVNKDNKDEYVYVIFQEQTLSFTFAIATSSDIDPKIKVAEKSFKATDIDGFKEYAKGLTTYNGLSFNEYLVSGHIDESLKTKFANIMIGTITYDSVDYYWDISNHIINGVLDASTPVLAVTESAVLVAISTNSTEQGYFTYTDISANRNKLYVQYSSTSTQVQGESVYERVTFKVVKNTSYSNIPSITPKPNGGYKHNGYSITTNGTTQQVESLSGVDATNEANVEVLFVEKSYSVTISVVDNNGNKICDPFTDTYKAKENFNTIRAKLIEYLKSALSSNYGGVNGDGYVYDETNQVFTLLKDCVDEKIYYIIDTKLKLDASNYVKEYDEFLCDCFGPNESKELSIDCTSYAKSSIKLHSTYSNLDKDSNNYVYLYIGQMTRFAEDIEKQTEIYLPEGEFDLGKIFVKCNNNIISLIDCAKYSNNMGCSSIGENSQYSHFKSNNNNYLTLFDFDTETKIRSIINQNGTPTNTSIIIDSTNQVLEEVFIDSYNVNVYIYTIEDDKEVLSKYGVDNWYDDRVMYPFGKCWEGKKIDKNTIIQQLKDVDSAHVDKIYTFAQSNDMYYIDKSKNLTKSPVDDNNGFIVDGNNANYNDVSLAVLVNIIWKTQEFSIVTDPCLSAQTQATINYSITYLQYEQNGIRLFDKVDGIKVKSNNAPYLWDVSAQNWTLNDLYESSNIWTPSGYLFWGYMDYDNGKLISKESGSTYYYNNNGMVEEFSGDSVLFSYGDMKHTIVSCCSYTELRTVYVQENYEVKLGRSVSDILLSKDMKTNNQVETSKGTISYLFGDNPSYKYAYDAYGFKITNITYYNHYGQKQINTNVNISNPIALDVMLNSTIYLTICYSTWYSMDNSSEGMVEIENASSTSINGVSYTTKNLTINTLALDSNEVYIPMNSYYTQYNVPSSNSDYDVNRNNGNHLLLNLDNWCFPKGLKYSIEPQWNNYGIFELKYTQSVDDPANTPGPKDGFTITKKSNSSKILVMKNPKNSYINGSSIISGELDSGELINTNIVGIESFEYKTLSAQVKVNNVNMSIESLKTYALIVNNQKIYGIVYGNSYYLGVNNDTFGTTFRYITINSIIESYRDNIIEEESGLFSGSNSTVNYNGKTKTITSNSNVGDFNIDLTNKDQTIVFEFITKTAQQYTFAINKEFNLKDKKDEKEFDKFRNNIGFIDVDLQHDVGELEGNGKVYGTNRFVDSIQISSDSIIISGYGYDGGIVKLTYEDSKLVINFYESASASIPSKTIYIRIGPEGNSLQSSGSLNKDSGGDITPVPGGGEDISETDYSSIVNFREINITYNLLTSSTTTNNNTAYIGVSYTKIECDSKLLYSVYYRNDIGDDQINKIRTLLINWMKEDVFTSASINQYTYDTVLKRPYYISEAVVRENYVEGVDYLDREKISSELDADSMWSSIKDNNNNKIACYGDYLTANNLFLVLNKDNMDNMKFDRLYGLVGTNNADLFRYSWNESSCEFIPYEDNTLNIVNCTLTISFEKLDTLRELRFDDDGMDSYVDSYGNTKVVEGTSFKVKTRHYYDRTFSWASDYEDLVKNGKGFNRIVYRYLPGQTQDIGFTNNKNFEISNKYASVKLVAKNNKYYTIDASSVIFNTERTAYTIVVFNKEIDKDGYKRFYDNNNKDGYYSQKIYYSTSKEYDAHKDNQTIEYVTVKVNKNNNYKREWYKVANFTTNSANFNTTTYITIITDFSKIKSTKYSTLKDHDNDPQNKDKGFIAIYPVYGPEQDNYDNSIFTYSEDGYSITGWNNTDNAASQKFFTNKPEKLTIPEWNFRGNNAYKINTIDFNDSGHANSAINNYTYKPSDIKFIYIGKNITKINTMTDKYDSSSDILNNTNNKYPSIARLSWSLDGSSKLVGYVVDPYNTNYCSWGCYRSSSPALLSHGMLFDKTKDTLLHCPAYFASGGSWVSYLNGDGSTYEQLAGDDRWDDIQPFETIKTIDPFAFAYKQRMWYDGLYGVCTTLDLTNIEMVGTGAFYGSSGDFARTIEFGSKIEKTGWSLIENKEGSTNKEDSTNVWFMGNVPFLASEEGFYHYYYINNERKTIPRSSEAILRSNPQNSGVFVTVYYQADYDVDCWQYTNISREYAMRTYNSKTLLFSYSSSDENEHIKFVIIEAPASAFYISGGIVKGIKLAQLSSLRSSIMMPLHDVNGNKITGVDYIGLVGSSGNKINQTTTLKNFNTLILNDYSYLGSILSTYNTSTGGSYSPGVTYNTIRFANGLDMTKTIKMGDGVHSPFGDNGAFNVKFVYLERVNEIKNCTTYLPNDTIVTLKLSSTSSVSIGNNALRDMTALSTLSGQMKTIGDYGISGCTNLKTLSGYDENEKGLMLIGMHFADGSGLTEISFSPDLRSVGGHDEDISADKIDTYLCGMSKLEKIKIYGLEDYAKYLYSDGVTSKPNYWTRDGILYGNNTGGLDYDYYLLKVPEAKSVTKINMYTDLTGDMLLGANKIAEGAMANNVSTDVTLYMRAYQIKQINESAFAGSSIKYLTFDCYVGLNSNSLDGAFTGATYLQSITITGGGGGGTSIYSSKDGWLRVANGDDSGRLYYVPENWGGTSGVTFELNCYNCGVTKIHAGSFDYNRSITTINITGTMSSGYDVLTSIDPAAFQNMRAIKSINVDKNQSYASYDGVLLQRLTTTSTSVGTYAYYHYYDILCPDGHVVQTNDIREVSMSANPSVEDGTSLKSIIKNKSIYVENSTEGSLFPYTYISGKQYTCSQCPKWSVIDYASSEYAYVKYNSSVSTAQSYYADGTYSLIYVPQYRGVIREFKENGVLNDETIESDLSVLNLDRDDLVYYNDRYLITTIKENAFKNTHLSEVRLPRTLIEGGIERNAFYNASSYLKRIYTSSINAINVFSSDAISNGLFGSRNSTTYICLLNYKYYSIVGHWTNSNYINLMENTSLNLSGAGSGNTANYNMLKFYYKDTPDNVKLWETFNDKMLFGWLNKNRSYGTIDIGDGRYEIQCTGCERYYAVDENVTDDPLYLFIIRSGYYEWNGYCRNCMLYTDHTGASITPDYGMCLSAQL